MATSDKMTYATGAVAPTTTDTATRVTGVASSTNESPATPPTGTYMNWKDGVVVRYRKLTNTVN